MTQPAAQLHSRKPWVRPWALVGPVAILVFCLPLLRPLNHPAELPVEEEQLVKMVQQNLTGKLYISNTPPISLDSLTEPSPTFALLLTGPAWLMQQMGFDFDNNPTFMAYMLIAVGVTLPVALSAGLIYRMGRLFELNRPQRAALGMVCVGASGLVSYATTLSAHALAAALLIAAAYSVMYALRTRRERRAALWAVVAGIIAMTSAALDPSSLPFAVLLPMVFLAWPVKWNYRALAIGAFLIGAVAPLWLHRSLHGKPTPGPLTELAELDRRAPIFRYDEYSGDVESGAAEWIVYHIDRVITATVGAHGLLSHFPLVLLGAAGVIMMMHRNWPESIKWLAGATLLAAVVGVIAIVLSRIEFREAAFATRWFIAFSPLLLFWSGAWLRREHRKSAWFAASLAAGFSIAVALIGAARPQPPNGYTGYTAANALERIVHPPSGVAVK
jgi:MFS family permease